MLLDNCNDLYKLLDKYKKQPEYAVQCFINDKWIDNMKLYESSMVKYLEESKIFYGQFEKLSDKRCERIPIKISVKDNDDSMIDFFSYNHNVEIYDYIDKIEFNLNKFIENFNFVWSITKLSETYEKFESITKFSKNVLKMKINTPILFKMKDANNFFIMIYEKLSLNNFVLNMSNFYGGTNDLIYNDKLNESDLVVVKYDDYYCFRGFILSINNQNDELEIFLFDLGIIIDKIKRNKIYYLIDIFSIEQYLPFIIYCTINNIQPYKNDVWSAIAKKIMMDKCCNNNNLLEIKFFNFSNGKFSINIFYKQQQQQQQEQQQHCCDLREQLIRFSYGKAVY